DGQVVVWAGHVLQRGFDLCRDALLIGRSLVFRESRREANFEEFIKCSGDGRVAVQRIRDVALAIGNSRLLKVAAIGTENSDVFGSQLCTLRQGVQSVAVLLAPPDRGEDLLEQDAIIDEVDFLARAHFEFHVVQENLLTVQLAQLEGLLADDSEAHVFENRDALAKGYRCTAVEDLKCRLLRTMIRTSVEIDQDW